MDEPENLERRYSRVLQGSVETRMRTIQQKISLAFTYSSTVQTEIKYGHSDRAKELLHKLHSIVETLTVHVSNPRHVSAEHSREFAEQLVELRKRLLLLESQIDQPDRKGGSGFEPRDRLP